MRFVRVSSIGTNVILYFKLPDFIGRKNNNYLKFLNVKHV